jgi:hypothetical protein
MTEANKCDVCSSASCPCRMCHGNPRRYLGGVYAGIQGYRIGAVRCSDCGRTRTKAYEPYLQENMPCLIEYVRLVRQEEVSLRRRDMQKGALYLFLMSRPRFLRRGAQGMSHLQETAAMKDSGRVPSPQLHRRSGGSSAIRPRTWRASHDRDR